MSARLHTLVLSITLVILLDVRSNASPFSYFFGSTAAAPGAPIVFIPGKGGNQLEARVRTPLTASCPAHVSWYRIWMDVWTFFRDGMDCWAESMHLRYNATTRLNSDTPGVEFRVPGWGTTTRMEYIDPSWMAWMLGNIGVYIAYLVRELGLHGYEKGVNLRGAPYDFRYAPHSQQDYFQRLEQLIEDTYHTNGGTKVLLIAHSMGGLFTNYFLNRQTPQWKDRFIAGLVTINTPWGGTAVVSGMFTAGYNWEIDAIDRLVIRAQQRSYETGFLLLPKPSVWSSDDVIIRTTENNFTIDNYAEFFKAINYTDGNEMLELVSGSEYELRHPGVPFYCIYSNGVPTPEVFIYERDTDFPDQKPTRVMGEGDGTVNLKSLRACETLMMNSTYPTTVERVDNVGHNDILSDQRLMRILFDIAKK